MSDLTIPAQTALLGIAITIQPRHDCQLRAQYPTALHGWFLDRVRSTSPTLSQQLHDGQDDKPFTISGFAGDLPGVDGQLFLSANRSYQWQITALSVPLCDWWRDWLVAPPTTLRLNSTMCQITDWQISSPPTTYERIWHQAATANNPLELTFNSPTSFRKRKHHMPLPIPENIFQSYLRRWNYFAPVQFHQDEFLEWVNDYIVLRRHDIRSLKVPAGKSGSVTGFIGAIQLGLTTQAKQHPKYTQLVRALLACAPYFQTGHKVTFGLGQTQSGWNVPDLTPAPAQLPKARLEILINTPPTNNTAKSAHPDRLELIGARAGELEPLFLSLKKRQGGQRAQQAARIWAQIIARLELGDSLKSIATDLEMPYDTVKKYAQIAKKQLPSSTVTETAITTISHSPPEFSVVVGIQGT